MKMILSLLVVCTLWTVLSAMEKPVTKNVLKQKITETVQKEMKELTTSLNQFGFDLFENSEEGENYFFSPAGISLAISMANEGAKGETYAQIAKVLNYSATDINSKEKMLKQVGLLNQLLQASKDEDGFELSCANHLWSDVMLKVNESFQTNLKDHFAAKMTLLDFRKEAEQARQSINLWAENNTNGHIKDLLAPGVIKPDTRMVLTNAIYFHANWVTTFDEGNTKPGEFKLENGKSSQLPMMFKKSKFQYAETAELQALKMLYQGGRMNMTVLLPKDKVRLDSMCETLSAKKLSEINQTFAKRDVEVTFPKFEVETTMNLGSTLKEMGMSLPFFNSADFSGISTSEELKIDEVIQKTFLKVDEQRTEAAAATAVVMGLRSAIIEEPQPPVIFKADHPFVIVLQDQKTGLIVFMGKIMNPGE